MIIEPITPSSTGKTLQFLFFFANFTLRTPYKLVKRIIFDGKLRWLCWKKAKTFTLVCELRKYDDRRR
jgi:hypothetical protein